MKRAFGKKLLLLAAAMTLAAGASLVYLFGGPFRFVERAVDDESVQHLRSMDLRDDPAQVAEEYLLWRVDPADRPAPSKLTIAVEHVSDGEAVVTIFQHEVQDDSIWATCNRIVLRRNAVVWLPVKHLVAWQCRNAIGWTTKTPS